MEEKRRKKIIISATFNHDTAEKILLISKKNDITKSRVIERIIEYFLEKNPQCYWFDKKFPT